MTLSAAAWFSAKKRMSRTVILEDHTFEGHNLELWHSIEKHFLRFSAQIIELPVELWDACSTPVEIWEDLTTDPASQLHVVVLTRKGEKAKAMVEIGPSARSTEFLFPQRRRESIVGTIVFAPGQLIQAVLNVSEFDRRERLRGKLDTFYPVKPIVAGPHFQRRERKGKEGVVWYSGDWGEFDSNTYRSKLLQLDRFPIGSKLALLPEWESDWKGSYRFGGSWYAIFSCAAAASKTSSTGYITDLTFIPKVRVEADLILNWLDPKKQGAFCSFLEREISAETLQGWLTPEEALDAAFGYQIPTAVRQGEDLFVLSG